MMVAMALVVTLCVGAIHMCGPYRQTRKITVTWQNVHKVYDGDTIIFNIPQWPELFGHQIPVRVRGTNTPELNSKDKVEVARAVGARVFTERALRRATSIHLCNLERGKYFRIVATVMIDGVDLADMINGKHHGVEYDGGKR